MLDRLTNLLEYLKESPDDVFLLFAIAQEYKGRQDFVAAREYFHRLRRTNPAYVGLYYHLGKLELSIGNHEEAKKVFEDGIRVAKTLGDMHALSELQAAFNDAFDL